MHWWLVVYRLLRSLSDFLDMVILSENKTDGKTVFGYERYALQVQQLNLLQFNGQMFTVDLGSFEEALNTTRILEEDLNTSEILMSVLVNATTSVIVPSNFIDESEYAQILGVNSSHQRLSYSVFLSDILFQSVNQSQYNVGSIIVSVRFNILGNGTFKLPIQTTFRTHPQV